LTDLITAGSWLRALSIWVILLLIVAGSGHK
jgi:hypothetical protein